MYAPVRPRLKKTNIVRSRNGCKSCRERRTKCDEQKPACGTCVRLGRRCEPVRREFKFRNVAGPVSEDGSAPVASRTLNNTPAEVRHRDDVHDVQLPGLDIVHSLQHTERDVFYSTYWEDACLPAVHPMFRQTTAFAWQDTMLRNAILALSSCNLSRISSENRGPPGLDVTTFSPSLVHQTRSQLYYSSAIRKFASLNQSDLRLRAEIVFTVLVLFAYIESSMGNFQGFQCHIQGLEDVLMELHGAMEEVTLKALLSAWMQVRFVVWWARAYFSAVDVHQNLPSVSLPPLLTVNPGSMQERRVMVLSILCESHRLYSKEVLRHWNPVVGQDAMFRDKQPYSNIEPGTPFQQLTEQERKLDEWLLRLPPSEQPIFTDSDPGFCSQPPIICNKSSAPLHFQTHDAALNFAYHVVARILQCTGPLEKSRMPGPDRSAKVCVEDAWVRVLIRIVRGTRMSDSISRNSYTIGFSGLMLAAVLRCQNASLGAEIQFWLEELKSLQPTEEGAFPIYQTLAVVRAVNRRREIGREVFGVTLPTDDAGGTPKFTVYNSQTISALLFHERCLLSGELCTQMVMIEL
ncbi:Zn(II)2Cys6 transcription factor domain-containing protein [Aspergillus stella-maris]|uniref:Zn(II)2Cys6 transcription factor domain-containing protein n=1 Tax=Aspergillus stella-maris TaxID=1810926 RepID=UPI003CCD66F4